MSNRNRNRNRNRNSQSRSSPRRPRSPRPCRRAVPEVREVDIEVRKVWDDYGVPLGILPQTGDESDLLLYASVGLLMLFCARCDGRCAASIYEGSLYILDPSQGGLRQDRQAAPDYPDRAGGCSGSAWKTSTSCCCTHSISLIETTLKIIEKILYKTRARNARPQRCGKKRLRLVPLYRKGARIARPLS